MRIGIIGAGPVGTTLGAGWARAGHAIVYGVRDPDASRAKAPGVFVLTRELARAVDVLVLATSWAAAPGALAELGDGGGRPLIDVTNPIGPGLSLAVGHTTSGGEQVAALATNARVVKAFHTTGLENMADPRYGDRRLAMPIAGDDPHAIATVATLAGDLGFTPVALPGLVHARELEPLAMLWIRLALQLGHGRQIGFGLTKRGPGDRVPAVTARARHAITVVGSGHIGGALARGWLRAGHTVHLAVRDPGAADIDELRALGAHVVPIANAAAHASIVVLAVPAGAVADVVAGLGALAGKVVIDCTNAIGKGGLVYGHTTSSSEQLAAQLPGARVVRSFNQQGVEVLENPIFGGRPATNFVASDDAEARALVLGLANDLGLDAVDAGALASARLLDPITLLWIALAKPMGTRDFGLALDRR